MMDALYFFILKIVKRFGHLSKTNHSVIVVIFSLFFLVQCVHKQNEITRNPAQAEPNPSQNRYAYEACRSQSRLYLEDQILKMPAEYISDHTREWTDSIPLKCIQFAQRNFNGHFAKCESEDARPTTSALRPCMTENYVRLTYNAYHDVMDCFSLDPKEFYLQIMIESGFHINAINKTGFDSGFAQFTGNGIKRVSTGNRVERTRRILLESSRPSCQRIASTVGAFDITSFTVAQRCSMIALPKNPYRGMLFNYLHTMLDQIELRQQLDDELNSINEIQPLLTEKIKRQFVYLAYNRGMTGIKRLINGYVENRKKMNQALTEQDFDLNQNLSRAKSILRLEPEKRLILQKAKIKNLSFAEYAVIQKATYVSDMVVAQDYVRRFLGDQCSRF